MHLRKWESYRYVSREIATPLCEKKGDHRPLLLPRPNRLRHTGLFYLSTAYIGAKQCFLGQLYTM